MNKCSRRLHLLSVAATTLLLTGIAAAQYSTPPVTPADLEAMYTQAIEHRTSDILAALKLSDPAKAQRVHDIILAQYRALKARDESIDAKLKAEGKAVNFTNREPLRLATSKSLHAKFLAALSTNLTPAQIEMVKDRMTYNKVEVTYKAYCDIVPNLTKSDKAKILNSLQAAREVAMDGGSAGEKSDIFQEYKDTINHYLDAHGHDVARAYQEWETRQARAMARPAPGNPGSTTNQPAK